MKPNVTDVYSGSDGYTEGLNCAIEIFVIDRVVIMPDSSRRMRHLIADKENAIVSRIGLELVHSGSSSCPGLDCGLHSHCATNGAKRETRSAGNMELTVRDVVKHVALVRMALAPRVFMRSDVCGFAEIRRIWIQCRVQVADLDPDAVRHAVVNVAVVIIGGRREGSGERIDPGARADLVLNAIQA
jgi:hypothetical protein